MFCTKCGNELFDEAIVCPKCGTPTQNFKNEATQAAADEAVIKCQCYNKDIDFTNVSLSKLYSFSSALFNGIFKFQTDRLIIQLYSAKDNSFAQELTVFYDDIRKNHLYEAKYMFLKMSALSISATDCDFSIISNGTNSISVGGDFDSTGAKIKQIHNELLTRCKK